MMPRLNLPEYTFKLRESKESVLIWDEFRKKYVVLTPEEWVRQNFLKYLHLALQYPKSLTRVELEVKYNRLKKRPDIVAFDRQGSARLMVECKAPSIKISQAAFGQIAIYNKVVQAKYLVVTNGMTHFCCEPNAEGFHFLPKIPTF